MEPVTATIGLLATVGQLVQTVTEQIMAVKSLYDQINTADARVMSLVSQLNSIKAALSQMQDLLLSSNYDEQLQADLELSLQVCKLHMDYLEGKMATLKTKGAAATLRFRSKARVVFESDDMDSCLQRLGHQVLALNLLISVLTSKSVTERKAVLRRTSSRKVFSQIKEDRSSMLDVAASLNVLRDEQSVHQAVLRDQSQPVMAMQPWKKFWFDSQLLGSKVYTRPRFGRAVSSQNFIPRRNTEVKVQIEHDEVRSADEKADEVVATSRPNLLLDTEPSSPIKPVRFSKMLAFGRETEDITNLISHGKMLWNALQTGTTAQGPTRHHSGNTHRLTTRYFDLTIQTLPLHEYEQQKADNEVLSRYRDVSSILFIANLASYHYYPGLLSRDLDLFHRTANDYHLWLAKITLFLNTTGLDSHSAHSVSEDVKSRFMRSGGAGANTDRIRVVVGEVDETAAGTIFAVAHESERVQESKWAGLTKSPTY